MSSITQIKEAVEAWSKEDEKFEGGLNSLFTAPN